MSTSDDADDAVRPWTAAEQQAARQVGAVAGQLLEAGTAGAGAAFGAHLLAGVHQARLRGLHRLAAAATRVVSAVTAAATDQGSFSLPVLSGDLYETLAVAHAVTGGSGTGIRWRGTARTLYQDVGPLRLAGLCMEPVVSAAGYAGVVVWLTDASGGLWSVADVRPGPAERAQIAAASPVAVGRTGLTHQGLARAGMIMSAATANPQGRLGTGARVQAVRAAGVPWSEPRMLERFGPLNTGSGEPNDARAAGCADPVDLVDPEVGRPRLLALTVCGSRAEALLAVDAAGAGVRLVSGAGQDHWLRRDNLSVLAAHPGLRFLAVARPAPGEPGVATDLFLGRPPTFELIAVGGDDLRLPAALGGHADLGFDRLPSRNLRPSGPRGLRFPDGEVGVDPLLAYRRRLDRVVSGGRRTLTASGVRAEIRAEATQLRAHRLTTAADLLERLVAAADPPGRDEFGRFAGEDDGELARAWLAAATCWRALVAVPG